MNINNILLCCMLMAPAAAAAEGSKASPDWMSAQERVEELEMANIDIEAQYWAWRVDKVQDVTYEELKEKAASWISTAAFKRKLFVKIAKHLEKRPVPPLNAEQREAMDANKAEIRRLLKVGRGEQTEPATHPDTDYCVELVARYWVARVNQGEEAILDQMYNWPFRNAKLKKRLLKRIEERMKMDNAPLSADENLKHKACREIVR